MERMNEKKFFEYAHSNRMNENEKRKKHGPFGTFGLSFSLDLDIGIIKMPLPRKSILQEFYLFFNFGFFLTFLVYVIVKNDHHYIV